MLLRNPGCALFGTLEELRPISQAHLLTQHVVISDKEVFNDIH